MSGCSEGFTISRRTSAPTRWDSNKTAEDIISDISRLVKEFQEVKPLYKLKPWWSAVTLESMKEVKRLDKYRENVRLLFDLAPGPAFFIGYNTENPRGKADRWYFPLMRYILEIVPLEEDVDLNPWKGMDVDFHPMPPPPLPPESWPRRIPTLLRGGHLEKEQGEGSDG